MNPGNNKRKLDDMSESPAAIPFKRRVVAKPKKRISIPGAFPTAEPPSQEILQRSAHSVVSARKTDIRGTKTGVVTQLPSTLSKLRVPTNRVEKSIARQPSTPRKRSSSKKSSSIVTPQVERRTKRHDVSLRFSFSTQSRDARGPLKKGRRRGRPFHLEDTRPCRPVLPPVGLLNEPVTPSKEVKVLNRSFSELLVTTAQNNLTGPLRHDYTETPSDLSSEPYHESKAPDPSVFSHPTKKREGYGFSYSEPLWYDSDEYPDTECDWDPDGEGQAAPVQQGIALMEQDGLFDDIVVMRDIGSFHIAKPQRILPCTKATREDTVHLKQRAKMLFKWDESGDVYAGLVGRLERMVCTDLEKKISGCETSIPSIVQYACKLRDFLQRVKEERVETGESRRAVEHEVEWASWLVEASRTGVMHLKTKGCSCQPDWEED